MGLKMYLTYQLQLPVWRYADVADRTKWNPYRWARTQKSEITSDEISLRVPSNKLLDP